jgi:hypothetical protein
VNWRVKALLQKTLAAVPFGCGERLNRDLPVWLGRRSGDLGARAAAIAELHSGPLTKAAADGRYPEILELGTGYNLFMAIPFALMGYRVTTVDISRDVTFDAARKLVDDLESHLARLAAIPACRLEEQQVRARHRTLQGAKSFEEVLEQAGIRYFAPYDVAEFAAQHRARFGYTTSHCVFEHVPPEAFPAILQMLQSVSRSDAVFSHQVDMRDHRSSEGFLVDPALSYLDYLTMSEKQWRFWNGNRIAYTNRWRKSDYVAVLEANGHSVGHCRDIRFEGDTLPLSPTDLHPSLRHYEEDELRVQASLLCGHIVAREAA